MKILLTGMTPTATNSKRRRSTYVSLTTLLPQILRDAGCDVDWRAAEVGERLDHDVALIEVFNCSSMMTPGYRWGALWAALQLPHIIIFADWQLTAIRRSLNANAFWSTRLCGAKGLAKRDALLPYGKAVNEVLARWASAQHPTVLPAFCWGTHDFGTTGPTCLIDPSLWVPTLGKPRRKTEQWIFASLVRHDHFLRDLNATWPVVEYCGDDKVDEEFLVKECYSEAWGVLSQPYDHTGAGWWRARFNYAVQTGSFLATWDECPLPSYDVQLCEFERMNHVQRDDVIARQNAELTSNYMPKHHVIRLLKEFIRVHKADARAAAPPLLIPPTEGGAG